MWFKNRHKKRRLEAEYVLDVRLSANAAKQARIKMIGVISSFVAAAALVCVVVWKGAEAAMDAFLYENNAFAIQDIEVSTDGILSREHIRQWSLVRPGQNLMALDLMKVKRDLELVPFIRQAAVERILPSKLQIRVSEREPIAKVFTVQAKVGGSLEQKVWYLDKFGCVMPPFDGFAEVTNVTHGGELLPVISGVNAGDLRPGRLVETSQIKGALELVELFEGSPMSARAEISRIDITAPDTLNAISPQGTEVIFGLKDLPQQLARWKVVYDHFESHEKAVISLDLSVSNNSPVKLAEAALVPKPEVKQLKRTRTKKRNV